MMDLTGLPGEELIREGLADLDSNRCTVAACQVSIGLTRLRRAGLVVNLDAIADPELKLYRLLLEAGGDAYSRYNALLARLTSLEDALDRRRSEV